MTWGDGQEEGGGFELEGEGELAGRESSCSGTSLEGEVLVEGVGEAGGIDEAGEEPHCRRGQEFTCHTIILTSTLSSGARGISMVSLS